MPLVGSELPGSELPGSDLKVCVFDVFGTVVDWRGSLIEDLPALGEKHGIETDWASFADDWRALYQPQLSRVRTGELPWTPLDELHREAFGMLLEQRGLPHPGDEVAWEFTLLWHRLRPWSDSVEGIRMLKARYVVATLSNGNVGLLIDMAKNAGLPWDHCFSGETFRHYKPDPEAYLGVADTMGVEPHQVMLVAAHNDDLTAARRCGLATAFVPRPTEHGPGQTIDLAPAHDWDIVGASIPDIARRLA